PDLHRAGRLGFARAGDAIALAGPFAPNLAASELQKLRGEPLPDGLPRFELDAVRAAQGAVREAVRTGGLSNAHDVAEGGGGGGGVGGVLPGGRAGRGGRARRRGGGAVR